MIVHCLVMPFKIRPFCTLSKKPILLFFILRVILSTRGYEISCLVGQNEFFFGKLFVETLYLLNLSLILVSRAFYYIDIHKTQKSKYVPLRRLKVTALIILDFW